MSDDAAFLLTKEAEDLRARVRELETQCDSYASIANGYMRERNALRERLVDQHVAVKAEREACAVVLEKLPECPDVRRYGAAAIRARGAT